MVPPISPAVHSKAAPLRKYSERKLQQTTHSPRSGPTASPSHLQPLDRAFTSTPQHPSYHSQPPSRDSYQGSTMINQATARRPILHRLNITEFHRRANIMPRRRSLPSSTNPSAELPPPPELTPTAAFQAYQARLMDATYEKGRLKIASDHYAAQMAEERRRETVTVRQERDEDGQTMSWTREPMPERVVIDLTGDDDELVSGIGSVFDDEGWEEGRYDCEM